MKYFYVLVLSVFFDMQATHIVGGDLSVQQVVKGQNRFKITLTLLFDHVNGSPESEVDRYSLSVFRRSDHQRLIDYEVLKVSNNDFLPYSNNLCALGDLKTRIIVFELDTIFDPSVYSEPVYFASESCCRNYVISNVLNPSQAGYAFYTEFPALWKDGLLVDNSSPVFNLLKGDYACIGRDLLLDFSASDADGDSLVYELCDPIGGDESSLGNGLNVGPYKPIIWNPNCNSTSLPNGGFFRMDSKTGIVTMHANDKSLNVLAVRCTEYRNGVKIGEVRRDYQVLVVHCYPVTKPDVVFKYQGKTYEDSSEIITIHNVTQFEVIARDSGQVINLSYQPLNFSPLSVIAFDTSVFLRTYQDSLVGGFTWIDCQPRANDVIYQMKVIVANKSCPQPNRDTVLIKFKSKIHVNQPPKNLLTPQINNYNILTTDKPISFQIRSFHTDSSVLDLDQFSKYILINKDYNMSLDGFKEVKHNSKNHLFSELTFYPSCELLEKDSIFKIRYVSTERYCKQQVQDTTELVIRLQSPPYSTDSLALTNIFTPDGDQFNDVFKLQGMPLDRCNNAFESAYIYNRWGVEILKSTDRQINWDGSNAENGIYIYEVNYQKSHYKGYVELRR